MILRVGLTGGIGSGKSTVAAIFEVLGIPVLYADETARRLMNEDEGLRSKIIGAFGAESYQSGTLNRGYLSSIVFNDREKLDLLNHLVHPHTIEAGNAWMQEQSAPYAVKEAALIFESGVAEKLDYVIGVRAPEALRIRRTMQRDNVSRDDVKLRMKRQIDESIKMKLCDFVIVNDEQQLVVPQVLDLHRKLLDLANSPGRYK